MFECDCTGTLYTGELCQIGLVEIPSIPELVVDVESDEIFVYARPTGYITVTLTAEPPLLELIPPSIQIDAHDTKSSFKMKASKAGTYVLKFKIEDGVNQYKYEPPEDKQVYVFAKKISILTDFDFDFLIGSEGRSCNSMSIGNGLELHSMCQIDEETFQTPGFTFIKSNNSLTLPLSIAGLDGSARKRFQSNVIDPSKGVKDYISSKHVKNCSQNCHHNVSNIVQIEYTLQNQFFQKTFIDQIARKLPKWLELYSTESSPDYNVDNLLTKLWSKETLYDDKGGKACPTFNLKEFPLDFSNGESINVYYSSTPMLMKVLKTKSKISDISKVCFLSGLHSGNVHILSSAPMKFVDSSKQHHVIDTLQSTLVQITNDGNARALVDVSMKMKTFDGKFQAKCLLSWNNGVKVKFFILTFTLGTTIRLR